VTDHGRCTGDRGIVEMTRHSRKIYVF